VTSQEIQLSGVPGALQRAPLLFLVEIVERLGHIHDSLTFYTSPLGSEGSRDSQLLSSLHIPIVSEPAYCLLNRGSDRGLWHSQFVHSLRGVKVPAHPDESG
jgi:hypothetical protein